MHLLSSHWYKITNFCKTRPGILPYTISVIAVLSFTFIWGGYGWREITLFSHEWWFDSYGHAIGGFGLGFIVLNYIKQQDLDFYELNKRKYILSRAASIVWRFAVLWEGLELAWDFFLQPTAFDWLAKAQKGSADTTIDALLTGIFGDVALISWRLSLFWWEKKFPNKAKMEEMRIMRKRMNYVAQEVSTLTREHRKNVVRHFWTTLKTKLKKTRY
jgi:hypothetical protein